MRGKKLLFLIGILFFLMIGVIPLGSMMKISDNPDEIQKYQGHKNTLSISWDRSNIIIDESGYNGMTWLEAVSYEWCSGIGQIDDPYVIENGKISGRISISYSSAYFIIRNCKVSGGIKLSYTNNGILLNNTVSHSTEFGIGLMYHNNYNKIIGNTLVDNAIGIYLLYDCTNNEIRNNTADYNSMGIFLSFDCNYNNITNNSVCYNTPGIYDYGGLRISSSHYNTISQNVVNYNTRSGIYLSSSTYNNVSHNIACFNDEDGIYMYTARFNMISNNFFSNNTRHGFFLQSNSQYRHYNTITENVIQYNNERGIYFDDSSNNLIYLNAFIGNDENARDDGGSNKFNTTEKGNYWDDYTGQDADGDGIGDEPYFIMHKYKNYDYLPLCYYGPMFMVNEPKEGLGFNGIPPNFSVMALSPNVDTLWYTLNFEHEKFIIKRNDTIDLSKWTTFEDGPVLITFYVNDTIGSIYSQEILVIKDTKNPQISIKTPKDQGFYGLSPPSFEVEIQERYINKTWYILKSDGTSSESIYFTDNETIQSSAWSNIADGNVTIIFYGSDVADNLSEMNITVHKDTVLPLLSIISPVNEQIFDCSPPHFNISVYDLNLHSIWYTLDMGASNHTLENDYGGLDQDLWDRLPEGVITLQFYVADKAGNIICKEVSIIKQIPKESNDTKKKKSNTPAQDLNFPHLSNVYIVVITSISIAGIVFLLRKKMLFK